jgi:AcrR family transcriptional regulator
VNETSPAENTRLRILRATLACVEQRGMTKTTLEDVAGAAGVSRATVYRYFPGGRDQVLSETVTWEVGNFLYRIAQAAMAHSGVEAQLAEALIVGHRAIGEHVVLQQVLSTEPEAILAELVESTALMLAVVTSYLSELLAQEPIRPDVDPAEAAEYLARMFISFLGSQGGWDLTDRDEVHRLVRTQFLVGVLPS